MVTLVSASLLPLSVSFFYSPILQNDWQAIYTSSHLDYLLYVKILGLNFKRQTLTEHRLQNDFCISQISNPGPINLDGGGGDII